jgi:hypothetical protein
MAEVMTVTPKTLTGDRPQTGPDSL